MLRTTTAIAFLCLINFPAHANNCWQVRLYVSIYGIEKAENWARTHLSVRQINEARKCLSR